MPKTLLLLSIALMAASPARAQEATNYLMVYFKDATHSVYFALSRDGLTFADVNGYKPVLYGSKYAQQRGVRDPHILRAPDSCYYLVMTDLNVAAQQMGFRDTRWERDPATYGWGNNRAIVMMKSRDLVDWSASVFRIDEAFPETADVGRFWAPQTIWDARAGKLLVYFTYGPAGKHNTLCHAYADEQFTRLTTPPQPFDIVPGGADGIDPDITEVDGRFHLFYCRGGHIVHAVADELTGTYRADTARVDGEPGGCEAPALWPIGQGEGHWLMCHPYARKGESDTNFAFSHTRDLEHFTYRGRMNEGDCPLRSLNFDMPNHGSVIQIPASDAKRLARHWKFDYGSLPAPGGEE